MQNIFWGVVIIAIGLVYGSSSFLGDFGVLNLLFDGLGVFWIGRGLWTMRNGAGAEAK